MSFHIVCDSCTDLTEEDLKKGCYTLVPLTLLVDGEEIIDDETFDQADFLAKVAASKESVKSACPAPESYMEAYSKADDIYVVTLSAELSGSYNSAVLGKNLYEEENGTKNIHVVNSRGAATTQVLIARKLNEYASQGMPFEEVVDKIEEYTTSLRTYFVLETLEVLRKNGRLSRLSATIAGALNIKPVMIGTPVQVWNYKYTTIKSVCQVFNGFPSACHSATTSITLLFRRWPVNIFSPTVIRYSPENNSPFPCREELAPGIRLISFTRYCRPASSPCRRTGNSFSP